MAYIGNIKDPSMLDFDLFFRQENYYGDLKASDINHSESPGNDQEILDGSFCIQMLEIRQKSLKKPEKAPKRQKIRTIILSKS